MGYIVFGMTNRQRGSVRLAQHALNNKLNCRNVRWSQHRSVSVPPIEENRRVEMTIRIISLNVQNGGGKRTHRIADWLATQHASAVILPEWRNNISGERISNRLTEIGFQTVAAARRSSENSLLLAAIDLTKSWEVMPPSSMRGGLVLIELIQGIKLLGCYFPQRQAKAPFFERCIQLAQETSDVPFVMIGDFNTGRNDLDIGTGGARFYCADLFEALNRKAGLIDLWRKRYRDRQEWTWRSTQKKTGFRIDHVFGNETFVARFPTFRCAIDHAPRDSGLSDHSAVVLEVH
jgi:exodeoxyribonuclease III